MANKPLLVPIPQDISSDGEATSKSRKNIGLKFDIICI